MSDELISKFVALAQRALNGLPVESDWRRLRIAVSPVEYEQLRQECFSRGDDWFATVRGIPFVVDEEPLHPMLVMEAKPR